MNPSNYHNQTVNFMYKGGKAAMNHNQTQRTSQNETTSINDQSQPTLGNQSTFRFEDRTNSIETLNRQRVS